MLVNYYMLASFWSRGIYCFYYYFVCVNLFCLNQSNKWKQSFFKTRGWEIGGVCHLWYQTNCFIPRGCTGRTAVHLGLFKEPGPHMTLCVLSRDWLKAPVSPQHGPGSGAAWCQVNVWELLWNTTSSFPLYQRQRYFWKRRDSHFPGIGFQGQPAGWVGAGGDRHSPFGQCGEATLSSNKGGRDHLA